MIVTKISALKPNRLCKSYTLLNEGTLQKSSAGQLVEGSFETMTIDSVTALAEFLSKLKKN